MKSEAISWVKMIAALLVVLCLCAIAFFHKLDQPSFWLPDELIHVSVVQEMQETGNWWQPKLRGEPYFNKPPLKMWLSQVPLSLFGKSKFSYRFLDALAAAFATVLTFFFAYRLFRSSVTALLSVLLLLGCRTLLFQHTARMAVQDSMLFFFSTASLVLAWEMFSCLRASQPEYSRARAYAVGVGLLIGCGLLTKSVGGLVPAFAIFLFSLSRADARRAFSDTKLVLAGIVPVLLLPMLYYLPHMFFKPWVFDVVVNQEVTQRALKGYHNADAPWFYLKMIFVDRLAVPPLLLVVGVFFALWRWLRGSDVRYWYLFCWLIGVLLPYQLSVSKLEHYLVPAFPAMSVLGALVLVEAWRNFFAEKMLWSVSGLLSRARVLGLFVFGCYGLFGVAYHLFLSGNAIKNLEQPELLDRLSLEMKENSPERPVLHIGGVDFGFYEMPYIRLLGDRYRREPEMTLEQALSLNPAFLILSPRDLEQLTHLKAITAYRYLPPPPELTPKPPFRVRESWLLVVSFVPRAEFSEFASVSRLLRFGSKDFEALYGNSGRTALGRLWVAQSKKGKFAFAVKGDFAAQRLGVSAKLNLGSPLGERAGTPIGEIFLNTKFVGTFTLKRNDLNTIEFELPGESWHPGTNILQFRCHLEGQSLHRACPLTLNWLSLRLSQ